MVPLLTLNPISSGIFQTKGFITVASSDFTDSVSAYMWVYGALNLSLRYVHLKEHMVITCNTEDMCKLSVHMNAQTLEAHQTFRTIYL